MSYIARQLRPGRVPVVTAAIVATIVLGACSGSDASEASLPVLESTSPEASAVDLVDPAGLSDALAASPEMALINVHIPYNDHIEGTDAFIAFDSILDSEDLPTDKAAPIALYCRSGNMSAQASAVLADAGYTNVIDLDGGMNAWEASGNPLVDDPSVTE